MSDKRPCRLKACKGVTHRGKCTRRTRYGLKGGRVAGQPLTPSEHTQRVKASKQPRAPSTTRNEAVKQSNLKRIQARRNQGVCLFCGLNHGGFCEAASIAGSISRGYALIINNIGRANRAKLEAQAKADLKRRASLNYRPLINLQAINNYPLDCIKCNSTKLASQFSIGFADDVGFGLCKPCDDSISNNDLKGGE